jgi:hypothetical protein
VFFAPYRAAVSSDLREGRHAAATWMAMATAASLPDKQQPVEQLFQRQILANRQ